MAYYLAVSADGRNFFGRPRPSAGARVEFDPELMFAAREQSLGRAVDHVLAGIEGLVVHEDPRGEFSWPCSLWLVDRLEGPVRLQPTNRWMRCRALTVRDELPPWLVFGDNGDHVAFVLQQARGLTTATVGAVAARLEEAEAQPLDLAQHRVGPTAPRPIGAAISHLLQAVDAAARAAGSRSLRLGRSR